MTIGEMMATVVNDYVRSFGSQTTMSRKELYQLLSEHYLIKYSSLLPQDYCYNRTNDGIIFKNHIHLFEYIDIDCYRLIGENYLYSGPVIHKPKGSPEIIIGEWKKGTLSFTDDFSDGV